MYTRYVFAIPFVVTIVLALLSQSSYAQPIEHCYPDGCVSMYQHSGETQMFINTFSTYQQLVTFFTAAWVNRGEGPARVDAQGRLLGMSCGNGSYFNVLRCENGATNYPTCNNICTNGATNYPSCNNNQPCALPNTCSDGNLVNACTGTVVQACVAGCTNSSCNSECTPQIYCSTNNDLYRRNVSCSATLLETCSSQCTAAAPTNYCLGNDVYQRGASCTGTYIKTCSLPESTGCSNGVCLAPLSPTVMSFSATSADETGTGFTATGHLQARPLLVRPGQTTQLYWNATNVASCLLTSTNADSINLISSGASGVTSRAIQHETVYTLSCAKLPGALGDSISEQVTVRIVPVMIEL